MKKCTFNKSNLHTNTCKSTHVMYTSNNPLTAHQVGPGSNDADETGVTGDELSVSGRSQHCCLPLCVSGPRLPSRSKHVLGTAND